MRIAVIEDEEGSREGLIRLIESIGEEFQVVGEASDAYEGMELVRRVLPDLVITDVCMSGMDGIEMIEEMQKTSWCKSQFVIVSAYSEFAYAQRALRFKVSDYLLKPISYEEVESVLYRLSHHIEGYVCEASGIDERFPIPQNVSPIVAQAIAIIKKEYACPLSLEGISARLNISCEYLSQLFSRQMHVTLIAYLKRYRVEVARNLLLERRWTVQEIASMVGYHNEKYFYKVFKDIVEISPMEYVKKMLNI